ncbi:MAG: hypothetical protein DRP93_01880 [Candidatus Neomarinimicrobiota bacterium]|nr:MAG: hypothetical protein DRP93_01880 [Candidatus Neomarinimicrobiota bacterium]
MRIIRSAPYLFVLNETEHVSSYVELATDELFTNIILDETVNTLNYYNLELEPAPGESLWIRISRDILDLNTNVVSRKAPTLMLELTYSESTFDTLDSSYVEQPTILINGSPVNISESTDLSDYLVNDDLIVSVNELRSDNPMFKYMHMVLVDNEGNVLYHKVNSEQRSVTIDLANVEYNDHVILSVAQTNINGITSKFSRVRLDTSMTLDYETLNMLPILNPHGLIMFNINTVLNKYTVIMRDSKHKEIYRGDTNKMILDENMLSFNEEYVIHVAGELPNGELVNYKPISFYSLTPDRTELFNQSEAVLMTSKDTRYVKNDSSLPVGAYVHVDELGGLFVDIQNGDIVMEKLSYDRATDEVIFTPLFSKQLLIGGNVPNVSSISKFFIHYLGENRFLMDTEGSFGRWVAVYRYDVKRQVIKLEHTVLYSTVTTDEWGSCEVLDINTFVVTAQSNGMHLMYVVTREEDSSLYNAVTTMLINDSATIRLLHHDNNHVIVLIDEDKYRYNVRDLTRHVVGTDDNVPQFNIGFTLPSGEYVYIAEQDENAVLVDDGVNIVEYTDNDMFIRTIRFENNTFMLLDMDNNIGFLYGDGDEPFIVTP